MATDDYDLLCRQIVEGAGDAIIVADRAGVIQQWNASAERVFGYSRAEALGHTLDLIIPEQLRARHWEGYRAVMQRGVTRYGDRLLAVPALRKDGTRISLEFSVLLVRDAAGTIAGAAAIVRDVTARWHEERALKQRVAELEGKRG